MNLDVSYIEVAVQQTTVTNIKRQSLLTALHCKNNATSTIKVKLSQVLDRNEHVTPERSTDLCCRTGSCSAWRRCPQISAPLYTARDPAPSRLPLGSPGSHCTGQPCLMKRSCTAGSEHETQREKNAENTSFRFLFFFSLWKSQIKSNFKLKRVFSHVCNPKVKTSLTSNLNVKCTQHGYSYLRTTFPNT